MLKYKELRAFHPGYFVKQIIDDEGVTQDDFAARLGTTPKTLSELVNGKINLSREMAESLSCMLGTSVDMWLKKQKKYCRVFTRQYCFAPAFSEFYSEKPSYFA